MATLIFQRATWSLKISRTSRTFAVSFTTALPQRNKPRHLTQDASTSVHPSRQDSSERYTRDTSARRAFRSTKFYEAQKAHYTTNSPAQSRPPYNSTTTAPPPAAAPRPANTPSSESSDLTSGLSDEPIILDEGSCQVDWARSFHGLSSEAFSKEAAAILLAPIEQDDIEVKPDGIVYLPEIKYRRILNRAFGPGAWGLAPRGETIVTAKAVTREYALVALGRLVSVARGEMDYFAPEGIPTAVEGCKSNALMRCCKDLGVASELWDPRYIRKFMSTHAKEVFVEHQVTKKRKKIWLRKDDTVKYPFKETKYGA